MALLSISSLSSYQRIYITLYICQSSLEQRVLHRVHQRLEAGFDDVFAHAYRAPFALAVGRGDEHAGPGGGAGDAVEDAHLVVSELDGLELWEEVRQRPAERA